MIGGLVDVTGHNIAQSNPVSQKLHLVGYPDLKQGKVLAISEAYVANLSETLDRVIVTGNFLGIIERGVRKYGLHNATPPFAVIRLIQGRPQLVTIHGGHVPLYDSEIMISG